MKYMSLKNMTEEEKKIRKRKQKAKAQRKYYQKHKEYYKNYSTKWARQEKENMIKKIDQLTNNWNELEEWLAREYIKTGYEELYRIALKDLYDKMKEIKEGK